MDLTDFREFIQERVLELDPTADISDGGAIDTDLIQPILDFVGESPFDVKAYEFILARLAQFNPDDLVDEGDALTDLAVKPYSFILDPLIQEITRIKNSLTFRFPTTMSRESAQSLGANFFVDMEDGSFTSGTARVYFATPLSITVDSTNIFRSAAGDAFVPSYPQSISQSDMIFNRQGSFFYWDIVLRSVEAGAVEVGPGELIVVEGLEPAVRVTNLRSFSTGESRETVSDFAERAREALTERSLVTARGVSARITELYADARAVEVSGYNDIEMNRDIIDHRMSGDRARVIASQPLTFPVTFTFNVNDFIVVEIDDGAGGTISPLTIPLAGTFSNIAALVNHINQQWALVGGIGTIASAWGPNRMQLHSGTAVPSVTDDLSFLDSKIKLHIPVSRSGWTALGYAAQQLDDMVMGTSGIIYSSMPGGILRPNTSYGAFSPLDQRFHVGGATDVFIRPTQSDQEEVSHPDVEDNKFVWSGVRMQANPTHSDSDRLRELSTSIRPGAPDWTLPLTVNAPDIKYDPNNIYDSDFLNNVQVEPGDIITLRGSSTDGTYVIAATQTHDPMTGFGTNELRISEKISGGATPANLGYDVSSTVRIDLTDPKRQMKVTTIHGTALQCFGASQFVNWLSPSVSGIDTNDFGEYGIQPLDVLVIHHQVNGEVSENADEYLILEVAGSQLKLNVALSTTERVAFSIHSQGGDPLDLPLVRLTSVELLDALGASIGVSIPYALPVLTQSRGFSGARVKLEGTKGIVSNSSSLLQFFDIPSTYLSFLTAGIERGDVLSLYHGSFFGTGEPTKFFKVRDVADFRLTLETLLPVQPSPPAAPLTVNDVSFQIGKPARGTARLYFQDPVTFEVEHERLEHPMWTDLVNGYAQNTYHRPLRLAVRDDDGEVRRFYHARSKGILGGRRLYPALSAGEDPELSNVDIDGVPTLSQDMSVIPFAATTEHAVLNFTQFVCRKYGLLPTPTLPAALQTGPIDDAVMLFPERLLGQGGINTLSPYGISSDVDTFQRWAKGVAMIPTNSTSTLQLPLDFFNGPVMPGGLKSASLANVEQTWGALSDSIVTLFDPPDGSSSPNVGTYRIASIPGETVPNYTDRITARIYSPKTALVPTDPLATGCGRASYDQNIINYVGAVGPGFQVGETVTNGDSSAIVAYVTGGTLWLYGINTPIHKFPAPASTWTGGASGTTAQQSGVPILGYLETQDGTKNLTFGAPLPGYISATDPGPWKVGNFIALYGEFTNSPYPPSYTLQAEAAVLNMGTWKITSLNGPAGLLSVENVADPSKLFTKNSALVNPLMGWVISESPRPVEFFGVYETYPTPFSVKSIEYEDALYIYDGRLHIHDKAKVIHGGLAGRQYAGYKCPYQITRPGRVRMSSTEMEGSPQDNLYYMDVDIISLGPDETHNLEVDEDLFFYSTPDRIRGAYRGVENEYIGEGYVLEVADPAYSLSTEERVTLAANPRLLQQGDPDLEENKIILSGRSIGVHYDRSDLVSTINNMLASDSERVACASLLARHFTPAYVRLLVNYSGLATVADLVSAIQEHVDGLTGSDRVEVSDLEGLMHKAGVDFIDQEFAVVALFHDLDRAVVGERSRNYIGGDEDKLATRKTTNRVSHFIADRIDFQKL